MADYRDVEEVVASRLEVACLGTRTDIPAELVNNVPVPLVDTCQAEIVGVVPVEQTTDTQVDLKTIEGTKRLLVGDFTVSTQTDTEVLGIGCKGKANDGHED